MIGYLQRLDDLLRARRWVTQSGDPLGTVAWLAVQIGAFGLLYGAVMGTFSGLLGDRVWQVGYSAMKVPILLLVTFGISLPSFFVMNTLFGLRADFSEAVRALLATQAALTVILAALSPFTALWYASSADYSAATAFNGLMFAIATVSAQGLLRHYYRPLLERNRRHRWLLRTWLVTYAFVAIQMAWVLRPFIGDPLKPVQFFRDEAWGNAYVVVANLIWGLIAH
jgi:hypothetical protein